MLTFRAVTGKLSRYRRHGGHAGKPSQRMGGFLFYFGGWGGRILQSLQRVFISNCRAGTYVVITTVEGEQAESAGAAVWASQVPTWNTYTAAQDRPIFQIYSCQEGQENSP